jgi:hypothetical protein
VSSTWVVSLPMGVLAYGETHHNVAGARRHLAG